MTSTEQRPKPFDGRKQDHGDAAMMHGHDYERFVDAFENKYDRRGVVNTDKTYMKEVIPSGVDDYLNNMTSAELELEANRILVESESDDNVEDFEGHRRVVQNTHLEDGEYHDDAHLNHTEAEMGIRGRDEIKKSLARQATLDHEYSEDDDADYNAVGMNVRTVPATRARR